ncbi:hypothetical protein ACOJ84_003864 [Morganella morganii]|uniref:hypothetical protein n=1 Tax=Morganella morganii TaxID=582 RepID=UPI00055ED826|nr:hypothetical protein [Morganella morganii]ELN8404596.1 hypothetical protein [Morganella morganii]MBC4001913.1 hypothetical protein [Morganella morganii]MDI9764687.1 hypothetical protein [Morganella morganii]OPL25622.1 hypothetical protein B5S45_08200 [Morganella morganii]HAU5617966.1 hypothetical protein [Morganella morganii]
MSFLNYFCYVIVMAERKKKEVVAPEYSFPDYYPKNVPPSNATEANGVFFRLVKQNPASLHCFDDMYTENPNRLKRFKGISLTYCYGTSLYSDEKSVTNAFDKFPEGVGTRFVAKGELSPGDGKMLKTGAPDTTHYTIWFVKDHQVHKKFSCIREVTK